MHTDILTVLVVVDICFSDVRHQYWPFVMNDLGFMRIKCTNTTLYDVKLYPSRLPIINNATCRTSRTQMNRGISAIVIIHNSLPDQQTV